MIYADAKIVEKLGDRIERAIAEVIRRRSEGRGIPLLPSQRTLHLMAKAAVAVYEAVAVGQQTRPEGPDERRTEP